METTQSPIRAGDKQPEWLAKVADLKQTVLERFAALPVSERDIVSPPVIWSPSAIVEHLILVEECVAGLWRGKLREVPNPRVGVKSGLASRAVSFVFSKTRFRVPTVPELEPVGGIGIEDLELRWAAARKRLVETLPENDHAAWILHPALGPLSSAQMCGILRSHLEHHLRHWDTRL